MLKMRSTPKPQSKKSSVPVHRTSQETFTIQKVSEIELPRSFMFYGRAGTGKTTISATFPGPRLLLDINDKGTDSISDSPDTDVIQIANWGMLEEVYWAMLDDPERFAKYKTLIIDTVSQMQGMCLEHILGKGKKDVSRAGDWGVMTKREWGEVAQLMKIRVVNFRDLPYISVFLAQDRVSKEGDEDEDSDDVMPEIGPGLMPSVSKNLCAAVYVIGNTFIRRKTSTKEINDKKVEKVVLQYCLRVGPHPICLTKIRKPKPIEVPSVIVDPSYADIIGLIKGE